MKRTAMLRKAPARPERADRSAEFASFRFKPTQAHMAVALELEQPVTVAPRIKQRKDQKIRDSANGEDCTVRIIGVCNFDATTTVWSHLPGLDGDRGVGIKALDLCGAYACSRCHDVVDDREPMPEGATRQSVMLDWHAGHMRSLVRLAQKGLI